MSTTDPTFGEASAAPATRTPEAKRHHRSRRLRIIEDRLAWRRRFFYAVGGVSAAYGALVAAGGLPGQGGLMQGLVLVVTGVAISGFGWVATQLDRAWWNRVVQRSLN